jgi:Fe-S oxidoreductase/FAD/FMN-containing dehydrogenase
MEKTAANALNNICSRVNYDPVERKLYGHDVGAMPGLVKPILGNTTPDAVVQPRTEEELSQILQWANKYNIAVTPRGKATSGYGGVLPIKQGIVIDFYFMKDIIDIDEESMTVTAQPGVTFEQLDRELKKKGLTLQMYPSSYPSATIGGWLAQGGAGFGSYEFGYFNQIISSVRVVMPSGDVRTLTGGDIELVSDAEGTTGFISQMTLGIQPDEPLDYISIACNEHGCFQVLIQELLYADLPIWSMMFINPKMAELKNLAPMKTHLGHIVGKHIELPIAYILTITFRAKDKEQVEAGVTPILDMHERAWRLSEMIAEHEWENRFKLMLVKRLGPSLIPSEVIIPVDNLGASMKEIADKIDQPLVKEGVIIREGRNGKPEAVILGFIPGDQRKFSFNIIFALSLSVMKIAEKFGGRAYSTGLYFSGKAESVIGKERLEKMRALKKEIDPNNILNPGKVLDSTLMSNFLNLATVIEPMARPIGNFFSSEIGERPPDKEIRGIPGDIAWYAYACSQCGYCVDECDQFYGRGWESQSPRGKWYWLREYLEGREKWDQKMVDTFIVCTTCELCNDRCSASLPIEPSWMKLRGKLIHEDKRMTFPPFEMMAAATLAEGNIWAGYRKTRDKWFPEELSQKHGPGVKSENVYFAGCTASYVEDDIGIASVRLLDSAGVDFTYLGKKENCCGTPMLVAGKWDEFAHVMKANVAAVKSTGANSIITSCPACDMMWRHVYPTWAKKLGIEFDITSRHYSEVVAERIQSGEFQFPENNLPKQTIAWHDSCHMGRVSGVYEPPRELIKAIPNVELVEMTYHHEEAHCCGSVLTLIKEPDVAAVVGEMRLNEALEAGADKVLAACPCCQFQLRVSQEKTKIPVEIADLSHFAAEALGFELPDPHPEVQAQWAVFEAMIALMTPAGFAALMGTMWDELISAMPMGMGGMMRFMGQRMPFMLGAMKPLFPILFPILLPKMMPKVMPTMLDRVKQQVPMPDYMAEQMPELMPKVMDNLMPHMIGDLVPLVTDPMIQYLTAKNGKNGSN